MIYLTKIDAARNLARSIPSISSRTVRRLGAGQAFGQDRPGRPGPQRLHEKREGAAAALERESAAGSGAAMRSRQCRVIGGFLPGRNPASLAKRGCASGKAFAGNRLH